MSLNVTAYFLGKDLVQLPRLSLLTLMFATPFYALATPTPYFSFYLLSLCCMSYAISGYAYVASVSRLALFLDARLFVTQVAGGGSAQLVTVICVLILTMLSGVGSQTLNHLNAVPILRIVPWLSPLRWYEPSVVEHCYILHSSGRAKRWSWHKPESSASLGNYLRRSTENSHETRL